MKTATHLLLAAFLTATCSAAQAEHDEDITGFYISPGFGYYNFNKEREVDDETLFSLGLGYRFESPWALELRYLESGTDDDFGDDVDYKQWRVDALYNLARRENVQPYLAFGAGEGDFQWDDYSDHDETVVNAGGGFKIFLTEKLAFRSDLRFINSLDEEATDFAITLGVAYHFGSPKAHAAPADSDGDGVIDANDRCPNTPAGEAVDTNGCSLDDDRDGVPNSRDECPDSKAGARVDEKGCYIILKETVQIEINVEFDFDSAAARPTHKDKVEKVVKFLKEYPLTSVTIEGHTDSVGSAEYNKGLSLRRAKTVADVLIKEFGVAPERVSVAGYGEEKPIADNSTEDGRQRNRRVYGIMKATVEKVQE
jgi:OOP family OmpA-OmpF porin